MKTADIYVGCAGWKLAREFAPEFEGEGTHLERYALRLGAAEINSSFYRPHRPATYAKWAASVGSDFRFSVKIPKSISHESRLVDCSELLDKFLLEIAALGSALGCLLIQLPPSLSFDARVAGRFFESLRARFSGYVVIEPRHESWVNAHQLLVEQHIGQVAADPARLSNGAQPGGWPGVRYWRLHGAPRIYYSAYETAWLEHLAKRIEAMAEDVPTWCIFDNTARDAALGNALLMQRLLKIGGRNE
uniref:DUF72 domain-containing protein n=1 Tax=Pseudomonas bambusae TaxID=3139142 RepID=UPI004038BA4C